MSDPLCGMACEFALARSIRDIAALLDAVGGADAGAPGHPVPPARAYREEIKIMPGRLRIAFTTTPASGEQVDEECKKAVHAVVRLLQELGHILIEDHPSYDWQAFLHHLHIIWASCTAFTVDKLAAALGRKPSHDNLEAVTFACYEEGKRYTAIDLCNAMAHGNLVSRQVGAFFQNIDVFLTPTIARQPALLGEINQDCKGLSPLEWTQQIFNYVPFTPLFNLTGQPAISLPLHFSAGELPVGVQFAGRFGDEATLLRLASQLEHARPWFDKKPPVHVTQV
jgi:amidase